MQTTDWPLIGPRRSKDDHRQGQLNRSERDGDFLLPRIIEEFGIDTFTKDDFRDALTAYVPTGDGDEREHQSRKLNVMAGLESLVSRDFIHFDNKLYEITDLGRHYSEQLIKNGDPEANSNEENYD